MHTMPHLFFSYSTLHSSKTKNQKSNKSKRELLSLKTTNLKRVIVHKNWKNVRYL